MSEDTSVGGITWHSSEEDGGPDVGISVYLGPNDRLWCGEISRKTFIGDGGTINFDSDGGWFIVRHTNDGTKLIAKCGDLDEAREFIEEVATWARAALSISAPLSLPHSGELAVWRWRYTASPKWRYRETCPIKGVHISGDAEFVIEPLYAFPPATQIGGVVEGNAVEIVARAICQSRTCEGISCCQWPAQGGRTKCPVKDGAYNDAAIAAIEAVTDLAQFKAQGFSWAAPKPQRSVAREVIENKILEYARRGSDQLKLTSTHWKDSIDIEVASADAILFAYAILALSTELHEGEE